MALYDRPMPTREDIATIAIPIAENADLASLRARSRSFDLFAGALLEHRDRILSR
jgi:hypothetical protein